jgi:hypothetical protein
MSALAVFNWRVYRPHAAWARALAGTFALTLACVFVLQSPGSGWLEYAHTERGAWLAATWIGVAIYVWATLESWRQHGMQVRRQALGLADPVVTDRMRLWALSMTAALVGSLILALCQALGVPVAGTPIGMTGAAVIAAFAGACLLLAFIPPAAYLARVRQAAGAEA